MAVTVRLFAAARAAAGVTQAQVEAGTLGQVLDRLVGEFPELSEVLPKCSFLVDEIACNGKAAIISEGSTLDVLPPFAGG